MNTTEERHPTMIVLTRSYNDYIRWATANFEEQNLQNYLPSHTRWVSDKQDIQRLQGIQLFEGDRILVMRGIDFFSDRHALLIAFNEQCDNWKAKGWYVPTIEYA